MNNYREELHPRAATGKWTFREHATPTGQLVIAENAFDDGEQHWGMEPGDELFDNWGHILSQNPEPDWFSEDYVDPTEDEWAWEDYLNDWYSEQPAFEELPTVDPSSFHADAALEDQPISLDDLPSPPSFLDELPPPPPPPPPVADFIPAENAVALERTLMERLHDKVQYAGELYLLMSNSPRKLKAYYGFKATAWMMRTYAERRNGRTRLTERYDDGTSEIIFDGTDEELEDYLSYDHEEPALMPPDVFDPTVPDSAGTEPVSESRPIPPLSNTGWKEWRIHGFNDKEIQEWFGQVNSYKAQSNDQDRIDAWTAAQWKGRGFSPEEASVWSDMNVPYSDAQTWKKNGYKPAEAAEWRNILGRSHNLNDLDADEQIRIVDRPPLKF